MRAMKNGSRTLFENSPVGSSKSHGIIERAIQSVHGMIRTIRSETEETWRGRIDVTHTLWPTARLTSQILLDEVRSRS